MDLRQLRYFLAVAEERNITAAAEYLAISQPALSRQMHELEDKLGVRLFERGSRNVTLTPAGEFVRERAEEIIALADRTELEVTSWDQPVAGPVYIGAAETDSLRIILHVARNLQRICPQTKFHIYSGDAEDLIPRLDSGLLDFALLFEPYDMSKYATCRLPVEDRWGVLMPRDCELAGKAAIAAADIKPLPLIISRQTRFDDCLMRWMGADERELHVTGTYNLINNAALMVSEGLGYALCLDGVVGLPEDSDIVFRPLSPNLPAKMVMAWKPGRRFTKTADHFLSAVKDYVASKSAE